MFPDEHAARHTELLDYIRVSSIIWSRAIVNSADIVPLDRRLRKLRHAAADYLEIPSTFWIGRTKGFYGYAACLELAQGIKLFCLASKPDMGVCLQISGTGLNTMRSLGMRDIDIASKLYRDKWSASRVDYAIDTIHGYSVRELRQYRQIFDWLPLRVNTQVNIHDTINNKQTMYFGSRKSSRFVRCYDKATLLTESGLYSRLEVEYKGDRARWALQAIAVTGYKALAYDLLGFMQSPNIQGFPTLRDIETGFAAMEKVDVKENSNVEWVLRCKKAIHTAIRQIGVREWMDIMNKLDKDALFD